MKHLLFQTCLLIQEVNSFLIKRLIQNLLQMELLKLMQLIIIYMI